MRNSLRLIVASLLLAACSDDRSTPIGPVAPAGEPSLAYLAVSSTRPNAGDIVTMSIRGRSGFFDAELGSFAANVHLPDGLTYVAARDGGGMRAVHVLDNVVSVALASPEGLADEPIFAFDVRVDVPDAIYAARLDIREATRVDFASARGLIPAQASSTLIWGDISNDGTVAAADAQAILSASLELTIPTGHLLTFGDANCDGTIGALDAQLVLAKVVGQTVTQFCIGTTATGVITGEIRDVVTFAPVAGAKVALQAAAGVDAGVSLARESTTDATGAYTIYNNVPDGTYKLAVTGTNFQNVSAPSVVVKKDSPQKVDATMTPSSNTGKYASVSGRVLLASGSPAAGAAVQLSGGIQTNGVFKATTTGTDGSYTFAGVSLLDDAKIAIVSFTVIAKATTGETGALTAVTLTSNEVKANVNVSLSSTNTPATSYYNEGFETGIPATWTKTGLWIARGTDALSNKAYPTYVNLAPNDNTSGAVPAPFTGTGAAWMGATATGNFIGTQSTSDTPLSGGRSTTSSTSLLTSPTIAIPTGAARATLAFDSWFEIESVNPRADGYDIMEITVTDVGTNITTSLTRLNPFEDPAASNRSAIPFSSGGFNRVPVWRPVYLNLDSYKGKSVRLGFCFRTVDALYNGFRGWLIDNVRVTDELGAGALADLTIATGSTAVGVPRTSGASNESQAAVTSCSGTIQTVGINTLTVSPTPVSLALDETKQLLATPKDANGTALAGKTITWTTSASTIATVSSSGLVTAKTAGSATITATVEGIAGTAAITVAGPANTMAINAGNNQNATVSTAVGTLPSVKVTNASGQGVSGIAVTFAVATGGGTITGASQTTNSSGIATVGSWTLGSSLGTNTLTATASNVNGSPLTFTATGTSAGMNLTIDGLYITQATQTMAGDVPLVANRAGLLRVFVRSSEASSAAPSVRVQLFKSGSVVKTYTITAPGTVPTAITEGTLTSSWNVVIDAADMQTGLSILAEVDQAGTVTETSETDNKYPVSGTALALDVRTVPTFNVTFVPVTQPGSVTAEISEGNKDAFMDFAKRVYPLAATDVVIRTPYSYTSTLPSSYGTIWSTLLSEINALRVAEVPSGTKRYYYGVIHPTYTSGGTGLGYVGAPASIGVDWSSSVTGSNTDYRSMTAAHEWGHNFGRNHIDCGGPSNPDTSYPHDPNTMGAFGYDIFKATFLQQASTKDLMSYCTPLWISDYTYKAVLTYRATSGGMSTSVEGGAASRGLLVWGQIGPDGVRLEPSFEVNAPAALPQRAGPHSVQALDAEGRPMFDLSFEGEVVDHLPGVRHFAYVVPLPVSAEAPAAMRLRANGREMTLRSPTTAGGVQVGAGASAARLTRAGLRSRLEWDAAAYPVAMVRDVATGEILSFARGGSAEILTPRRDLEVVFSDGAKSTRRTMRVPE